jgi:hypothetical protein
VEKLELDVMQVGELHLVDSLKSKMVKMVQVVPNATKKAAVNSMNGKGMQIHIFLIPYLS